MNKIKEILKSQKGQGVWEYMIILVGIGAVAVAITAVLNTGLVTGNGTDPSATENVTSKINTLIDDAAK